MALEELKKLQQDIEAARAQGYSDDEIKATFMSKKPKTDGGPGAAGGDKAINLKVDFSGVKEVDLSHVTEVANKFPVKEIEGLFTRTIRPVTTICRDIFDKVSDWYDQSQNFKNECLSALGELKNNLFKVEVVNQKEGIQEKDVRRMFDDTKKLLQKIAADKEKPLEKTVEQVEVVNQPEIKFPEVQKVEVEGLDDLGAAFESLNILSSDPQAPISVRLSNGHEFYEAMAGGGGGGAGGGSGREYFEGDTVTDKVTGRALMYKDGSNIMQPVTSAAGLPVSVAQQNITGVGDGSKNVTTAGTAVALAASTSCKKVTIMANEQNTGIIVVGGSTVVALQGSRRGIPLLPLTPMTIDITNLSLIYIDATVSGEGVTYTYFT